jgi:hypothetical protein
MAAYIENSIILEDLIWHKVHETPAIDAFTHLYDLRFGSGGFVWSLDSLLTSAPLVNKLFRGAPNYPRYGERPLTRDEFATWEKTAQTELVWEYLFKRQ